MSNYRKRRSYPGSSSPPRKKRNSGKNVVKTIAIILAVIACISLLVTLLPGRNSLTCEHDYKTELIRESCEDAGYTVYTCKHCDDTYKVQTEATGHNYETYSLIRPTCTSTGSLITKCSQCEDMPDAVLCNPLTHTKFAVARSVWCMGYRYHIFNYGSENMTPFKFLDFGEGDTCEVELYIYNDTDQPITEVSLSYGFGRFAYSGKDGSTERIPGTYATINLASKESTIVKLTIPRSCYISNLEGKLMHPNGNDSEGRLVSYRDLGIRFDTPESASGALFISCLSDSVVTESLVATNRYNLSPGVQFLITDPAKYESVGTDLTAVYEEYFGSDYTCIHEAEMKETN